MARVLFAVATSASVACASLGGLSGSDGGAAADADHHASDASPDGRRDATLDVVSDVTVARDARPEATSVADASDARPLDSGPRDAGIAVCPILTGGNASAGIPAFTGTQTVDGLGQEFCSIYATVFNYARSAFPVADASGVDASALLRVGWSATGVHLHVHVNHEPLTATTSPTNIFAGDAVELYLSTTGKLSGPYGPGNDEAVQIIVGPPGPPGGARSGVFTVGTGPVIVLDPSQFASRLVDGGYEVELQLSWSDLSEGRDAGVAAAGDSIGFDIACDIARDAGRFQTFLYYTPLTDGGRDAAPTLCHGLPEPYCDDRTWRHPFLVAP